MLFVTQQRYLLTSPEKEIVELLCFVNSLMAVFYIYVNLFIKHAEYFVRQLFCTHSFVTFFILPVDIIEGPI